MKQILYAPKGDTQELGEWHLGRVGDVWTIILFLWLLLVARLFTESSFLNCWRDVKEGSTDWLKFRWRAALLRVVSEMLRDIPSPGLLEIIGSETCDWWPDLGKSGNIGDVGVGGGLVWAPEFTKPCNLGFLGGWGSLKLGIIGEFLFNIELAPKHGSYLRMKLKILLVYRGTI